MRITRLIHELLLVVLGLLLASVVFWGTKASASPNATFFRDASAPQLHYQGLLLDPDTGDPRIDGSYPMVFSLYTAASGGSPLWTESKDVTVSDGIFSTLLGDTTPFGSGLFDGQDLWLGITVGADPQMTPRQPLAFVPQAIFAINSDTLDGRHSYEFAQSGHDHNTLPIAYGRVSYDGTLRNGAYNVESVTWNDSLDRYEIDITDVYYSIDDVTVITAAGDSGSCPGGASARQSSVAGHLLVYIVDKDGAEIQCSFDFVSYEGQ